MWKPLAFWDACSKRSVLIMRFRLSKRVPIGPGVPRGGVWGRVEGVGGGFPAENEGKGEGVSGVGGGGETGKGTGKSMRKLCRNYPLANYPLVSPPNPQRNVM